MQLYTDPSQIQKDLLAYKKAGKTIGFVPTMGFLHEGHASLMAHARPQCDILVVSIYVNPLQFAPNEDLDTYPRDPERDEKICAEKGVDIIFRPENLYSQDHVTYVRVEELSKNLCGESRPSHFEGVSTVVARLFGLIQPDIAVFGQKDFQQLAIIQQMVRDLAMPIVIVGAPLIRDHDGLALSSRNRYLTPDQRTQAQTISKTLFLIQEEVQNGNTQLHTLRKLARESLRVDELDYMEFVHPDTLLPIKEMTEPTQLLIAAWVGSTRLIDNIRLEP